MAREGGTQVLQDERNKEERHLQRGDRDGDETQCDARDRQFPSGLSKSARPCLPHDAHRQCDQGQRPQDETDDPQDQRRDRDPIRPSGLNTRGRRRRMGQRRGYRIRGRKDAPRDDGPDVASRSRALMAARALRVHRLRPEWPGAVRTDGTGHGLGCTSPGNYQPIARPRPRNRFQRDGSWRW